MSVFVAIVLVVGLFLLNAYLFVENKKTPKPEGCENLTPDCGACGMVDCVSRVKPQRKEDEHGDR